MLADAKTAGPLMASAVTPFPTTSCFSNWSIQTVQPRITWPAVWGYFVNRREGNRGRGEKPPALENTLSRRDSVSTECHAAS